ncbi:hypothetical protein ENHYD8BJ_50006 [Enhydrobacter sp. 8BJ]|nr:hypothetical protein ENHYD8BJ_50006 [Enhydrobacter sp. 8BJ]
MNPNYKVLYSYHDSNPMVNFERTSEYQPLNDAKSQSALKPQLYPSAYRSAYQSAA